MNKSKKQALKMLNFISLLLMIMMSSMEASNVPIARGAADVQTLIGRKYGVSVWPTRVRIFNNLEGELQLTVHCKSKDDDLGPHVVASNEFHDWKFRVSFDDGTLFFCGLTSIEATGSFKIYAADRDASRCPTKCDWRVHKNGVHGYRESENTPDLFFPWPKPLN